MADHILRIAQNVIEIQKLSANLLINNENCELLFQCLQGLSNELLHLRDESEIEIIRKPWCEINIEHVAAYFIDRVHIPFEHYIKSLTSKQVKDNFYVFNIKMLIYVK